MFRRLEFENLALILRASRIDEKKMGNEVCPSMQIAKCCSNEEIDEVIRKDQG